MIVRIEDLRQHLNMPAADNSKDAPINKAYALALAWTESYLDRKLELKADVETTFDLQISLRRYPLTSITSITHGDNNIGLKTSNFKMDAERGQVKFHQIINGQVVVSYTGGYDDNTLPADILYAFLNAFDVAYGLVQGGSATPISSAGGIKAISVPDVGRVEYDTGATSSTEGAGNSAVFGVFADLLSPYVRQKC